MIILGIETSCDETSIALVNKNKIILSNIVVSQIKQHKNFGGVVPEVAARNHLKNITFLIKEALIKANLNLKDVSAIAGVIGPGLYGSLLIGSTTAKSLALALNKPFIAVNHLEAHILTPRLLQNISFPYLALLISGGHTQFIAVKGINDYKILGDTLDDALGEAYDKTARLLGYPYPGGKYIEILAKAGIKGKFHFKPPLIYSKNCNFSFSGLKTAVRQTVEALNNTKSLTSQNKSHIALAFEEAILATLKKKTQLAIQKFTHEIGTLAYFIASGGVAANQNIRSLLSQIANSANTKFFAPPLDLCGDNAAMVAWVGIEKMNLNLTNSLNIPVNPNLSLASNI